MNILLKSSYPQNHVGTRKVEEMSIVTSNLEINAI